MNKNIFRMIVYDVKKQLSFDDEVYKIVLNTKCDSNKVPDKLKRLEKLLQLLMDENRFDDAKKAIADREYREGLYK